MAKIYGHRWVSSFGEMDDGTWLTGLSKLDPEMLGCGLRACVDQGLEWPPTLPEFRRMCCGVDSEGIESLALVYMPSKFDMDRMTRTEMRAATIEAKGKAMTEIHRILRDDPKRFFKSSVGAKTGDVNSVSRAGDTQTRLENKI